MKIYAVKYIDYLDEDSGVVDYYMNKDKAKKVRDELRKSHQDDYGIYIVKEIEVKE